MATPFEIFCSLVFSILVLVGLGKIFGRILFTARGKVFLDLSFAESGFLGFFVCGLIANLAHFFVPLEPIVAGTFSIFGMIGFLLYLRKQTLSREKLISASVLLFLCFIFLGSLLVGSLQYDTGLYHLPAVLWNKEAPVTLGLANLHGRLAFNSLWISIASVFQVPILGLVPVFTLNATLCVFVFLFLFDSVRKNTNRTSLANLFAMGILFYLGLPTKQISESIGSIGTDLAASLFTVLAIHSALTLADLEKKVQPIEKKVLTAQIFFLFLFTFLAITIKLSQALLILLPLGSLFIFRDSLQQIPYSIKKTCVIAFSTNAVIWMTKGVLTSGCLFYPMSNFCFESFSWSIPRKFSDSDRKAIEAWAKAPGQNPNLVLGNWSWFPIWLKQEFLASKMIRLSLGLITLGSGLFIMSKLLKSSVERTNSGKMIPLTIGSLLICLMSWFLTVPGIRFGYGFILSFGFAVFATGIQSFPALLQRVNKVRVPIVYLGILFLALFPGYLKSGARGVVSHQVWPLVPSVSYRSVTQEGGSYFIPEKGDQCWTTPAPCTPYLRPSLTQSKIWIWPKFEIQN